MRVIRTRAAFTTRASRASWCKVPRRCAPASPLLRFACAPCVRSPAPPRVPAARPSARARQPVHQRRHALAPRGPGALRRRRVDGDRGRRAARLRSRHELPVAAHRPAGPVARAGAAARSTSINDQVERDVPLVLRGDQPPRARSRPAPHVRPGGTACSPITGGADLHDTAVRDLRFGFAYALVPHRASPRPAHSLGARPPGGSRALRDERPDGRPRPVRGRAHGGLRPEPRGRRPRRAWFVGAEVGARLRPITELLGRARRVRRSSPMLGVGYDILPRELLTATRRSVGASDAREPGSRAGQSPRARRVAARGAHGAPARRRLRDPAGRRKRHPVRRRQTEITRPRFRFTLGRPLGAARARYRRRRGARRRRPMPHGSGRRQRGRLSRGGRPSSP